LARVFRELVKEVGKRVARSDEKKNLAWSEAWVEVDETETTGGPRQAAAN
jgi:hypothetical protein